jgi:soluble lytic murein transglycosylase-like protein
MNRMALAVIPGFLIGSLFTVAFAQAFLPHQPSALSESVSSASAQTTPCSLNPDLPQKILQWCPLIERYAAQNGVEASLIAAVMLQESGGQPQVISHSGAVGLLQVMPRDGIAASFMCANGPCFSRRPTTQELLDPETNIAYGTRLLAGLLNKYNDTRSALQAYGPINIGYTYADKVIAIQTRYTH